MTPILLLLKEEEWKKKLEEHQKELEKVSYWKCMSSKKHNFFFVSTQQKNETVDGLQRYLFP